MTQKLRTRLLLALTCAALLLLLGCGDDTGGSAADAADASAPNAAENSGESAFAEQADADAAFEALLKEALAAGEPKQLWADDFCTEGREAAVVWHVERLNCEELGEELLTRLIPNAVVKKKSQPNSDTTTYELRMDGTKLTCMYDPDNVFLQGLTTEQLNELLPQAEEWFAGKCGMELRKWTGRTNALAAYTGCIDGLQIVPRVWMNAPGMHEYAMDCGLWSEPKRIAIYYPFTLGAQAGTVSLNESFSLEELRMTIEFGFDPSKRVVEAYRSCELCYMLDGQKEMLVPVWWVRGTSCNLETGGKKPIELWFDAETGQQYDLSMH